MHLAEYAHSVSASGVTWCEKIKNPLVQHDISYNKTASSREGQQEMVCFVFVFLSLSKKNSVSIKAIFIFELLFLCLQEQHLSSQSMV